MAEAPRPLDHLDYTKKEDTVLHDEATAHLGESPSLQVAAELLGKLREMSLPWWTPAQLRETWSASARLGWYAQRPDLRQQITSLLTGLAPNAARKKTPDFQAGLIDAVIDDGDISVATFEEAFDHGELAVYGPAADFWAAFRQRMPWDDDSPEHQSLIGWLIQAMLTDTSSLGRITRVPILTPWDVRTAISGTVWHTRMPLEVRVAIDEARHAQERSAPSSPFHAKNDLSIALPDVIARNIPLKQLKGVFDVAERALGFGAGRSALVAMSMAPSMIEDAEVESVEEVIAPTSSTKSARRPSQRAPGGLEKRGGPFASRRPNTMSYLDEAWGAAGQASMAESSTAEAGGAPAKTKSGKR